MLCIITVNERYDPITWKETLLTASAKLSRLRGNCGRKSSKKVCNVLISWLRGLITSCPSSIEELCFRESLVGCSKSTPLQCVKLKLLPNNFCGVGFMDGTLEAMTLSHFCLQLLYFELRVAVSSADDILLAYFYSRPTEAHYTINQSINSDQKGLTKGMAMRLQSQPSCIAQGYWQYAFHTSLLGLWTNARRHGERIT